MVKTTVEKVNDGVSVNFVGDIQKSQIDGMVEECSSGNCSCSCDTDMLSKVEGMSVSGSNGNVTINLKGKYLEKSEIEKSVNSCFTEQLKDIDDFYNK